MRDWIEYVHLDSTSAEVETRRGINKWNIQTDSHRQAEEFELLLEEIAPPVPEIGPLKVCQFDRPVGSKHDTLSVSGIPDLIALFELNILVFIWSKSAHWLLRYRRFPQVMT